jgi:hypothetical protein
MFKRSLLAVLLALPFLPAANVATAEVPFPECLSCPEANSGAGLRLSLA